MDPNPESNFASVCAVLWKGDKEPVQIPTSSVRKLLEHEHEFNESCLPSALRAVQRSGWHTAAVASPAGAPAAVVQQASARKGRRDAAATAVAKARYVVHEHVFRSCPT